MTVRLELRSLQGWAPAALGRGRDLRTGIRTVNFISQRDGESTCNCDYQFLLVVPKAARKRVRVTQIELPNAQATRRPSHPTASAERRIDVVEMVGFAAVMGVTPQELPGKHLEQRARATSPKTRAAPEPRG